MLLAKPYFSTFSKKTIVDATTSTTGHYALSFGNWLTLAAIDETGDLLIQVGLAIWERMRECGSDWMNTVDQSGLPQPDLTRARRP
jgi:predicted lactoylglutathione lyase